MREVKGAFLISQDQTVKNNTVNKRKGKMMEENE
jgi:hypothetical protein